MEEEEEEGAGEGEESAMGDCQAEDQVDHQRKEGCQDLVTLPQKEVSCEDSGQWEVWEPVFLHSNIPL